MTSDAERFAREVVDAAADPERDDDLTRLEASWPELADAISRLRKAVEEREAHPPTGADRTASRPNGG